MLNAITIRTSHWARSSSVLLVKWRVFRLFNRSQYNIFSPRSQTVDGQQEQRTHGSPLLGQSTFAAQSLSGHSPDAQCAAVDPCEEAHVNGEAERGSCIPCPSSIASAQSGRLNVELGVRCGSRSCVACQVPHSRRSNEGGQCRPSGNDHAQGATGHSNLYPALRANGGDTGECVG